MFWTSIGLAMKAIEKNEYFGAKAGLFSPAMQMKKNPTEAENVMWKILTKIRQSGFTFRRQHPSEFYIADFYCHRLRLVIEVLGVIHTPLTSGEWERWDKAKKMKSKVANNGFNG